ncbi:MAG: hypothetical protein MR353_08845 [Spirochaetia bacterium]|nr:hypothetical protein [Spirochaetia bacterium]MDD7767671.1 hypothetical protein [Treponema sp.]
MSDEEEIKDETNYEEQDSTVDNTEEETATQEEHPELDVNKTKNFLQFSVGFVIRSVAAIILSILALRFILPSNSSDVFYKLYFVLFIVFELGVITCYVFANRSIFLLQNFSKRITENKGRYSSLNSNNKKVNDVCIAYKKSFLVSDDEDYHKTRANSDLYFGPETWLQDTNPLPLQAFLKIIPGTFIGFGILGTFIGFAGGLSSINISDSQSLLDSVQQLLNGLRNAFNTSIVGMLASMFCNFVLIHPLFNKLDSVSKEFCDYLDNLFYVTEVDAMAIVDENNNKIPFPVVLTQILTRLEGVSSNINSMGLTIGDQVTKSVKETLDKTIEKIIKEEIEKLKTDLNSSIKLLEECQTSLQNAPQQLKNAATVLENSAKNSSEIFEKFSDDLIDIKNAVALLPDDFKNVNDSISGTVYKLADNQTLLASAISEASEAFEKTTEISQSLSDSYDEQTEKINESISRFSDILTEYKETSKESKELLEGYKGMDIMIAKIFNQINENTEGYSKIIGDSLEKYLKGFKDATKDISKQFADATLALSEEVRRLNGANDTNKD